MKRNNNKTIIFLVLLVLLVIGVGYAYLTSNLSITGATSVAGNTWDIHFTNLVVQDGSVTATTPAAIDSNDNTKVNYSVRLEKPGDFYEFSVDVKNFGTLPGKVSLITNNGIGSEYSNIIEYSVGYSRYTPLNIGDVLNPSDYKTIIVRTFYKDDINSSDLPNDDINLDLSFQITYIQSDTFEPVIDTYTNKLSDSYLSNTYRNKIKTVSLGTSINIPDDAVEVWDIGVNPDTVKAYIVTNSDDSTKYDLFIQGNGSLIANKDSSKLFYDLSYVDSITGLDNLNTSSVTNMNAMFQSFGYNSTSLALDLGDNFDTSNVTNMGEMFYKTGYYSTAFTLDLGDKFDTSKVTNMSRSHYDGIGHSFGYFGGMFADMGYKSTVLTLDLGDKFDTSNVTNFGSLFNGTGYSSPVFTLDLGDKFDTSRATNMTDMFYQTGCYSTVFTLDLGDKFDTSNVTDMYAMFYRTSQHNPNFTINLGDKFDTSNVIYMDRMFDSVGYSNPNFELDLGDKFDTTKVVSMDAMFQNTGYNSTKYNLDLGDKFDTSNVTDMSYMFNSNGYSNPNFTMNLGNKFYTNNVTNTNRMFLNVGYANSNFVLDLGPADFSNSTNRSQMFYGFRRTNILYVKDSTVRDWIVSYGGNSNLSTSNVLIKG